MISGILKEEDIHKYKKYELKCYIDEPNFISFLPINNLSNFFKATLFIKVLTINIKKKTLHIITMKYGINNLSI